MRSYIKQAGDAAVAIRAEVEETVRRMLAEIREEGDAAVRRYAKTLDSWEQESFQVSDEQIQAVAKRLPETFKEDFALCMANVQDFAKRQLESMAAFEAEIALHDARDPVRKRYSPRHQQPLGRWAVLFDHDPGRYCWLRHLRH